jgi:hypothetical protein
MIGRERRTGFRVSTQEVIGKLARKIPEPATLGRISINDGSHKLRR